MLGRIASIVVLMLSWCCAGLSLQGCDVPPPSHRDGDDRLADAGEGLAAVPDAGQEEVREDEYDAGDDVIDVESDGGAPVGPDARIPNPTCVASEAPPSDFTVAPVFASLAFNQPLGLFQAPGDPTRLYVQERAGVIRAFPNVQTVTMSEVEVVLDFSANVSLSGDGGFLSMTFHPDWPSRLELFALYTEGGLTRRTVLSRFRSLDGLTFELSSEERLFVIDEPAEIHNGGSIAFGPDGYLYIGLGDGGGGNDPTNAAQRLNTNLGKFIRIHVDVPPWERYAIPPGNPFAADATPCNLATSDASAAPGIRCAEIFATGFRNPWRWSFDRLTGDLWAGDVGEDTWEEINLVTLGGNYGWRIREGSHCTTLSPCQTAGLLDPVAEYDRGLGASVTGGYVYRGTQLPGLVGSFVFGDFASGRVFTIRRDSQGGPWVAQLAVTNFGIGSFAQLADAELYILDIFTGTIHQLVPKLVSGPAFPSRLSETGCFMPTSPLAFSPGLVPYGLNAESWSDGATKERAFAIPDGTAIAALDSGDLEFPTGSVLVKTFSLHGRRIETRLLVRHLNGVWAGYSYEWADDGSDAVLLESGKQKDVNGQPWLFPSRAQCMQCHTAAANFVLGPELGQLNREFLYPATGQVHQQLEMLTSFGYLAGAVDRSVYYEPPFGTGPLELRARAYLHANCSSCHQNGKGRGPADWRYGLSFTETNACNVAPLSDLGVPGASLIAPGSPFSSIVSLRVHATDSNRMPPLGSALVDTQGAALLDQWISSLQGCP